MDASNPKSGASGAHGRSTPTWGIQGAWGFERLRISSRKAWASGASRRALAMIKNEVRIVYRDSKSFSARRVASTWGACRDEDLQKALDDPDQWHPLTARGDLTITIGDISRRGRSEYWASFDRTVPSSVYIGAHLDSSIGSAQTHPPKTSGGKAMAIGEVSGEFNHSITSSTFERQPSGGVRVLINLEGTATGYGQVTGTLTLVSPAPGATAGPVSYTGAAFLESGEVIGASGEGCWQQLDGERKWRVRRILMASNGAVLLSDGTLDLATRSFGGTIAAWT